MTSGEGAAVIDAPGRAERPRRPGPRRARCQGVRRDAGAQRLLVRAARRRGPRAGRRERLGQEHARQDPQRRARRPTAGRVEVAGTEVAAAQPQGRAGARHRHRLPGGPGRRDPLGARQRLARHRRHLADQGPGAGEAAPGHGSARRAPRPAARPRPWPSRSSRSATARPAASCGPCCASPRILILDEATSALDVATRDRLFAIDRPPRRRGRRRHLHHPPDGRDRGDRRSHHGDALGRDGRQPRAAATGRLASSSA